MKKIKVAFMCSRPLGAQCLEYLSKQNNVHIVGVVTTFEEETRWWAGRGTVIKAAKELGIPVVDESEFLKQEIDVLLLVLSDNIVREPLLSHPKRGCINCLHLAELPRYRGCNSIAHAIMNARDDNYWIHGVSMIYMDSGIDTGPIITKRTCAIYENDTGLDLYLRIEEIAFKLFCGMLPKILKSKKRLPSQKQGESKYYYKRNSLANKEVNLSWSEDKIYDFVRALQFPPHEPAYISAGGRKIYLSIK